MLFRFLILIPVCVAFPLKCPEPAQWSFRARSHCPDASKYFCLRNDLINGYSENCTVYDFLQPGRKNVLRGGLDADVCSSERYQPWPINFYTNVSSNCIFLKSTCNEEGQVIYDKGNRNIDATCTCDYTRGYDFLVKPHNPCFCVPTKEDCSCYLKTCPNSNDRLSTDYECRQEDQNLTVSECTAIIYKRLNTTRMKNPRKYIHVSTTKNSSAPVQKKLILTAICIGMMFFFCIGVLFDELMDRYFWKVYCIYQPLGYIQLIEGQSVAFKYILSNNNCAVSFFKDDQFIAETKRIKKTISAGCCKVLEFTNVVPSDEGLYCLEMEGNKSAVTRLTIQRMFTSKIDPQLCVEGDTLQMTCSVYADNIEVQWYKGKQVLNECKHILIHRCKTKRMLTIEKTTVIHSGKYFVQAGNVEMEIPVTVKDMFKRPLVNVTIMEGLDAKFECETELKNVPVQWFYNSKNIIYSSERRQIQRFQGRVHTLTILQTSLQDSGQYSIDINGYKNIVELNVKAMPETIKHMSVYDREAFLQAARIGTTKRYNIRVMIVGKEKAGKTCLLRRLMNEEIYDVISTDGINIERRTCHIDIKTGEWQFSSSDKKNQDFSTNQKEELADCGFWDFAGQKEFYATHQTFLSSNAVYLLVVDISEDFKSKTYENMIEKEFDTIGEYIDFWLDNIHCYCTDDKKTPTQGNKDRILNPPVIIVGTGIDKVPRNDREDRKQKFLTYLSDTMSTQPKRRHFRKPHFLSNKFPSNTRQEFEELRKDIFCKAKDLSNWEENLPVRWVVLEKEICSIKVKKDILHAEAFENKKVMLYAEAQSLADECSFPNVKQETSELDSFLKYEHEIGNIVFFKEVKESIVLDPEWLVDVFRCFVSHEYNDDTLGMTEWDVLAKTGKLEDTLIETLLQKVPCLILRKHKNYLLELMEEFSIIVKPKASINDIYMPCMIKPRPFREILGKVDVETEYCKKSSWFCLVFNFLPPSYFNHILVSFVKNNPLFYDKKDSRLGIYRNVGIFQLNNTGSEILVMCLSKNLIAMKVVQFNSTEDVCYSYIKTQLINLVESINLRYRINVNYEIRFKCQGGSLYGNEGIGYDEAMEKSEYRSTDHYEMHSSKDIYKYWLKEEEVADELKKKGRRRCIYCKNMCVYMCYDCNIDLCKDCSRKHDDEKKYVSHSMQLISDSFILNCKFHLNDDIYAKRFISDIKCLPDGEVVAAVEILDLPELLVFSISGKRRHVIQLDTSLRKMDVVDKNTVAVFLLDYSIAIVDIQQTYVQYIRNVAISDSSFAFISIENEFYISEEYDIVVIDMSGRVKRRFTLSFTPDDMCYDVKSQHIYCIVREHSKLICIDRDGNDIFTFTDPNMTNLTDLTIDNEGNALVLCRKGDYYLGDVIKVDSNGEKSEVVITNINTSGVHPPRICYDHLTNSVVVIGLDPVVYIYKKK